VRHMARRCVDQTVPLDEHEMHSLHALLSGSLGGEQG
jgi:hypothetical protein